MSSKKIRQVANYRWPSGGEQPIGQLRIPLSDVAQRIGLKLEQWDEEGVGPARGAWCRLPSGRVVQLYELSQKPGINVSADLSDVSHFGSVNLLLEVMKALKLDVKAVSWVQSERADRWVASHFGTSRTQTPLTYVLSVVTGVLSYVVGRRLFADHPPTAKMSLAGMDSLHANRVRKHLSQGNASILAERSEL